MEITKVVQVGLGPVGQKITQFIAQRENVETVGAVDISPDLKGRNLGELCGLGKTGITIRSSVKDCIEDARPDAVILTTVSSLENIVPQIEEIVSYGVPVVSTCEELSYPWPTFPDLSKRIDKAAKNHQVAVLGTGVNPGFLMDSYPIFLTAVSQEIRHIRISRIQDAAHRRVPFQRKIGAGLTPDEFERKKENGTLRHVGLLESALMIAGSVGWRLTNVEESLAPVLAEQAVVTEIMTIQPGHVLGVEQIARGYVGDEEMIELFFRASLNEPDPEDFVEVKGLPNIKSTIAGGINGDVATAAITINTARRIVDAQPGLRTMFELPIISFC